MANKQIQEMIAASKRKLVEENILDKSVLQLNITAKNAHDSDNFDWRFLCAAQLK
jgi:hypothetical protein